MFFFLNKYKKLKDFDIINNWIILFMLKIFIKL